MQSAVLFRSSSWQQRRWHIPCAVALLALMALTACEKNHSTSTRQVLARVNGRDITIHQLKSEFATLAAQGAAVAATPTREMLDSLIDEQLLVDQGKERKLDRDPQVVQADEKARRQILVQAVQDNLAVSLPKPTSVEVRAFYEANPALFAKRRIYTFNQFIADASDLNETLKARLDGAKTRDTVVSALKAGNVNFRELVSVRNAEQLPMAALPTVAAMNRGDVAVVNDGREASILQLIGVVEQPATLEQAMPLIEQYLFNTKKKELVAQHLKALRSTAKIEYLGGEASKTANAPPPAAGDEPKQQTASEPRGSATQTAKSDDASHIRKGILGGKL